MRYSRSMVYILLLVILALAHTANAARAAGTYRVYLPLVTTPGSDLSIAGIEYNQSVQTATNNVPLIADRATLIRVYGKIANPENVNTIVVSLAGSRNGQALPGSPLRSNPRAVPSAPSRADLTSSFNFNLPREWLGGSVDLVATIDANGTWPERDETNNSATATLVFNSMPALNIKIVPIQYTHTPTGRSYPAPTNDPISSWVMRSYPISALDMSLHAPIGFAGDLRLDTEWERLLRLVSTVKALDNAPQGQIYYGLVSTQNGGDTWLSNGSFIAGIGWIGDRAAVSLDLGATRQDTTGRIAAHEIGHNHGRFHAPCGALGSTMQPYPYAGALLGPDNVGYDYATSRIWVPGTPDMTHDIMSYCTPQWMSDFTYRGIYDNARNHNSLVVEPGIDGLLVRVQFDGYGIPSLAPVYEVSNVAIQGIGDSPYHAELLDARGAVIASYPLKIKVAQNEPPVSLTSQDNLIAGGNQARSAESIAAILPMPAQAVARIRITSQGASIAEQTIVSRTTRSSQTATIERSASSVILRWTPGDRPALVRYSTDGAHWVTLGVDVQGGMLPVDADLSRQGTFEVIPAGGRAMTTSGV